MGKSADQKGRKVDPFKTRKTKTPQASDTDLITPPEEIAVAIDAFRECQDQAKHFEGEATIHKDKIVQYSSDEYAKRVFNGMDKSFKILGEETMVTYVAMDASAGLSEEDAEVVKER